MVRDGLTNHEWRKDSGLPYIGAATPTEVKASRHSAGQFVFCFSFKYRVC